MFTRFQERRIRNTFPFLDLAAELRNMIYEEAIDLSSIKKFFDKRYDNLNRSTKASPFVTQRFHYKTPTVFLINRQIYAEAVSILSKKSITFDHGLLGLQGVHQVMSEEVLQKLSKITTNTKGHPILKENTLAKSWAGYMTLIDHLSIILGDKHKLRTVTIDIEDPALERHVKECWYGGTYQCGFADSIKEVFNKLCSIRGVDCVTITGIPPEFALKLKTRMESKPKSLLDLPGEIREQIYGECVDLNDANTQFAKMMKKWVEKKKSFPEHPAKTTPSILLVNKQISKEASYVLSKKPVTFTFPEDHGLKRQFDVPSIRKLICDDALLKIKHLTIRIEAREWMYALEDLIPEFYNKHSLETLHVFFRDNLKQKFRSHPTAKYPDGVLHDSIQEMAAIRGVGKVTFEGDLPEVYTTPLADQMQKEYDPAGLIEPSMAIRGDGEIVIPDVLGD